MKSIGLFMLLCAAKSSALRGVQSGDEEAAFGGQQRRKLICSQVMKSIHLGVRGGASSTTDGPCPDDEPATLYARCGSPRDACMNERNFLECVNIIDGGCQDLSVLESCPLQFRCGDIEREQLQLQIAARTEFFKEEDDLFNVVLPLFGSGVTRGYLTVDELRQDLTNVANYAVNQIINRESRPPPIGRPIPLPAIAFDSPAAGLRTPVAAFASTAAVAAAPQAAAGPVGPSAAGVDDFETNNQEEGVDEADQVKSDGLYVYAAYGDRLVIWRADNGRLIQNVTLPPVDIGNGPDEEDSPIEGPIGIQPIGGPALVRPAISPTFSSFAPPRFVPKARISSMLLVDKRLVLIVSGYGQEVEQQLAKGTRAFYENYDTRVMVYDTSFLPFLIPLIKEQDIQGGFRDARSIGNAVHIVTTAGINRWELLDRHLVRWQPQFRPLNDTEYMAAARRVAEEEAIPSFVENIINAVATEDSYRNLARISLWMSTLTNATRDIFSDGVVDAYTQITSFDVMDLDFSSAGAFTPSSGGNTYAVDDMLIFTMQGWNFEPRLRGSAQTTFLLGFKLDGATARPHAVGSTPGFLLNQFSLDIVDGFLRIATSIRSVWPVEPIFVDSGIPGGAPIRIFRPRRETKNQVIIMRIPTGENTTFTEVSRIDGLGKPGELFTAVRFFDKLAYAVTFERTDPFYSLNVTDPFNPKVLGELSITGFSQYLHSVNEDNTLLVAVGQEADERGRVLGLQLSLFDSTNATNPQLLQRFLVENDPRVFSSSAASFDFKAFRYVPLVEDVGSEAGILIIPLRVTAPGRQVEGNFDGFVVYDVSREGISERQIISHVESRDFYGCYYNANLPQRSFVFDGNVTTLKGHSVVSTDLDTGTRRWILNMPKPEDRNFCVFW